MRRTAWLIAICWWLPETDPVRQRVLPVLLARLDLARSDTANDTTIEWMGLRLVPTSPSAPLARGRGADLNRFLPPNRLEFRQ